MPSIKSENKIHEANCIQAEMIRQGAVSGASQAAIKTAEIVFWQNVIASAKANNLPYAQFGAALRDLGVTSL